MTTLTRSLAPLHPSRVMHTVVALVLAGSIAVALGGAPSAHAAQPANICTTCPPPPPPPPPPPVPTIAASAAYTGNGQFTVSITGGGFTPGGEVFVSAGGWNPPHLILSIGI